MGKPIDVMAWKKSHSSHQTIYSKIYAKGYHDAYNQLKADGQLRMYSVETGREVTTSNARRKALAELSWNAETRVTGKLRGTR